jgi:site-specific recombinase XerD
LPEKRAQRFSCESIMLISPVEFSAKTAGAAYANDWVRFVSWCQERQVAPIAADPEIVAEFLEAEANLGYSFLTISHRLTAIGHMHRRHRALPPLLHENGGVIRRTMAQVGSVHSVHRPLQATTKVLQNILHSISEDSLEDTRDRAILALRIAGAFRMSELAKLSIHQTNRDGDKLEIYLGGWGSSRSGRRNVLTFSDNTVVRPVALLDIWLAQSEVQSGRLFRQVTGNHATGAPMTEYHIAEVIQSRALAAGYDWEVLSDIKARKSSVGPRSALAISCGEACCSDQAVDYSVGSFHEVCSTCGRFKIVPAP